MPKMLSSHKTQLRPKPGQTKSPTHKSQHFFVTGVKPSNRAVIAPELLTHTDVFHPPIKMVP